MLCHNMSSLHKLCAGVCLAAAVCSVSAAESATWPPVTPQAKPHAYWWWMGSAVDTNNITKELTRYHDAGMGGVHIIPIYGAKGWEAKFIPYLSPEWMEMLDYTVREARRLGMEVDMTTGTGWCFGGPEVTEAEANAVMVSRRWSVPGGQGLPDPVDRARTQALMAFGPDGAKVDLLQRIAASGAVDWVAPAGSWVVYAVSQKPGPQKVKRAAPGGEGWMLNLAYPQAMTNFLRWMDEGFANYQGAKPRAQYHDSYEYKMDWSPVLFAEFEQRRGYRLQDHLDVFLGGEPAEEAARLKCDYRETISDIMAEETLPQWVDWAHADGFITRNEAHGSPGNWLDLYAAADIPETEMFYQDRNKLISKFASSAAHVSGKNLTSAETGTWLAEHFTETLADMKYLLDDLFLSGVNHVFYHGTCYSPDEAPWPGWVFYASYEMNPRNAIWHDVGALNAYATRCQSVLQAGQPDNDILVYWPIHDFWSDPEGMVRNLTVHARDWFEEQPIGRVAKQLWDAGYAFDYISDAQLKQAGVADGKVQTAGGRYSVIVVPECKFIKLETFKRLLALMEAGAVVIFENDMPKDIAGGSQLEVGRAEFKRLLENPLKHDLMLGLPFRAGSKKMNEIKVGRGSASAGDLEFALSRAGVAPEPMARAGLSVIRRTLADGQFYFIANRGKSVVNDWIQLAANATAVTLMDPMTGEMAAAAHRKGASDRSEVKLDLAPGASVILRTYRAGASVPAEPAALMTRQPVGRTLLGDSRPLNGNWQVKFLSGGPVMPEAFSTAELASWTQLGDTNAQSFAGTAVYSLRFDAPGGLDTKDFQLDLGTVCQSARVRLNGEEYGTLFTPPFRVVVDHLKPRDNVLEVEVTNTSANRIRDLDRRGVQWQNFYDINFVNLNYKKFNAANWPLADSGLLGPVTLTPLRAVE